MEASITSLSRQAYEAWNEVDHHAEIQEYFKKYSGTNAVIFITSGILNANQNTTLIEKVNYELPWNVIKALEGFDIKIVTFGTILEQIKTSENSYVQSKIKLSERIQKINSKNVIHFRLHTLYGYGLPSEFMFLGQIFTALKNSEEFKMTSGFQIREYHHLDDVVQAIDFLISENITGVADITFGNGIMLRELAVGVFEKFQQKELLKIGEIEVKQIEVFENKYQRNKQISNLNFREPVKGVHTYFASILN